MTVNTAKDYLISLFSIHITVNMVFWQHYGNRKEDKKKGKFPEVMSLYKVSGIPNMLILIFKTAFLRTKKLLRGI
jgi:hypothetical protein